MQPLFAVLGAMAQGESRIIDLRFPGRYGYAEELEKMGVIYQVKDNLLLIKGGKTKTLQGSEVKALDLRAGAALMIASLIANSPTTITNTWQIFRGYDQLQNKLTQLGVNWQSN